MCDLFHTGRCTFHFRNRHVVSVNANGKSGAYNYVVHAKEAGARDWLLHLPRQRPRRRRAARQTPGLIETTTIGLF
jgi:hypothetical protein